MLLRFPVGCVLCCSCLLPSSRHLAGSLLLCSLHLVLHLLYLHYPNTDDSEGQMGISVLALRITLVRRHVSYCRVNMPCFTQCQHLETP